MYSAASLTVSWSLIAISSGRSCWRNKLVAAVDNSSIIALSSDKPRGEPGDGLAAFCWHGGVGGEVCPKVIARCPGMAGSLRSLGEMFIVGEDIAAEENETDGLLIEIHTEGKRLMGCRFYKEKEGGSLCLRFNDRIAPLASP
jgi:hypothetical protein